MWARGVASCAPERHGQMRSEWRPRYIGIARCRVGAPLAFIALATPDGTLRHKGKLCNLGD